MHYVYIVKCVLLARSTSVGVRVLLLLLLLLLLLSLLPRQDLALTF